LTDTRSISLSSVLEGTAWLPERPWGIVFLLLSSLKRPALLVAAMFAVPFKFHLEWDKFR
jgi:hypothetical protein